MQRQAVKIIILVQNSEKKYTIMNWLNPQLEQKIMIDKKQLYGYNYWSFLQPE